MEKLILLLAGIFALWLIVRRIKKQINGKSGCGSCQGSCGLDCSQDDH